jgi:hypothetical protein
MAKFKEKAELCCGIITGLSGVIAPILWLLTVSMGNDTVMGIILLLLFFIVPPTLVAVGAYVHIIRRKTWGKVLLLCSSTVVMALSQGYVMGMAWVIAHSKTTRLPIFLTLITIFFAISAFVFALFVDVRTGNKEN